MLKTQFKVLLLTLSLIICVAACSPKIQRVMVYPPLPGDFNLESIQKDQNQAGVWGWWIDDPDMREVAEVKAKLQVLRKAAKEVKE